MVYVRYVCLYENHKDGMGWMRLGVFWNRTDIWVLLIGMYRNVYGVYFVSFWVLYTAI